MQVRERRLVPNVSGAKSSGGVCPRRAKGDWCRLSLVPFVQYPYFNVWLQSGRLVLGPMFIDAAIIAWGRSHQRIQHRYEGGVE